MMHFDPTSNFIKKYKKLSEKERVKFNERMEIFSKDEFNLILKNHKLHGEYDGYRSINITSDLRVIYKKIGENHYLLHIIGIHSELYE